MMSGMKKKIGLWYARFYFRRDRDRVMTFTDAVKRARSAIVVMPADKKQSESARSLLNFFQNKFRGNQLTVVLPEGSQAYYSHIGPCDVLRLNAGDIDAFELPRRTVVRRIQQNEYDLALDLNVQFNLPSAFLCKASRSRVRVGFGHEHADVFFNFQIIADPSRNMKSFYERVISCLAMF